MLGPRVLKTGISVTLALYICSILNLQPAVFAGVAAIFTIQPSIYRSWKHISDQLKTNTLGAAIAFFAITFLSNEPVIVGLVMILVILISLRLKIESTIPLTLVTVLAIMSAPSHENWWFALNRFYIILIGMGSAFLINLLVLPPKYKKNFLDKSHEAFQHLSLLLRTAVSNEMTEKSYQEHLEKLYGNIQKLEDIYKIFDEEREKMNKVNPVNVREIVVFKQMLKTLNQGVEVLEIVDEHFFQSTKNKEDIHLFDEQLEHLIKCHEYYLLKFERKIKMDEERPEDEALKESTLFLEQVMETYSKDRVKKMRIVVIGASIFEYAFQLERLNTLIEHFIKKSDKEDVRARKLTKLI